jgi:hypothetical protein
VEWVEELSVMEDDARKAAKFWQGKAQRLRAMTQKKAALVTIIILSPQEPSFGRTSCISVNSQRMRCSPWLRSLFAAVQSGAHKMAAAMT